MKVNYLRRVGRWVGRAAGSFLKCISSVNASYKMGVTSPIALFFFPQQVLKKIKKRNRVWGKMQPGG